MSLQKSSQSIYDKALKINLDPLTYGTFAEIGAGQEVANWFFRASATAGTVAKTISAYDMTMSDAIYGKTQRYVSRERLSAMLDHEFGLLVERLSQTRGDQSTFFSFCNTVRARGYRDTGECHGWLGIRFQLKPGAAPSEILIHCRLLDWENTAQMEALGVLGVNLIYAAFYYRSNLEQFVNSLKDGLTTGRIEVDMLRFGGEGFHMVDNRICALELVQCGLTEAALFMPDGEVVQASEVLYKKPVQLLRGSFSPVTNLHLDMIEQTSIRFNERLTESQASEVVKICEMSMSNLLRQEGKLDVVQFLARADALQRLGKAVLVSSLAEFHRVSGYLARHTSEPIAISLSIGLLNELFKEKWSVGLPGGILESFGRLFRNDLCLYVYPWKHRKTGEMVSAKNFKSPEHLLHLYQHLRENRRILDVDCGNEEWMRYTSRDLFEMICQENQAWKQYVPERVYDLVESSCGA